MDGEEGDMFLDEKEEQLPLNRNIRDGGKR